MVNLRKTMGAMLLVVASIVLSGCGGSEVESGAEILSCNVPNFPNEAGTACVAPPPIQCPAPTVPNASNDACVVGFNSALPEPVFFPAADQAVLYYNRADVDATNTANDSAYEGWRLHTWSNDACDAYADPDTAWENGRVHTGIDPTYGAYWVLDLKPGYAGTDGACHNFIIHIGTDDAGKELGGGDFQGNLSQDDPRFARMNFTLSGVPTLFEFPIDSLGEQPVSIEGTQAHWLDAQTILWDVDTSLISSVKLHYSADAAIEITLEDGVINSTSADLSAVDLSAEQEMIAPHLNSLPAFAGAWTTDDAKAVLKTQAIVGGYDADGKLVAATRLQIANVLDEIYTKGDADADEATLGITYTDSGISTAVWAPTAQNVDLKIYNSGKVLTSTLPMNLDENTGVWSYDGDASLDRQLYRFEVTVYSPVNDQVEVLDVTDPYSVSLSVNGRFSQFVNLDDDDLKPEGWDDHSIPTVANFEDIVIYEGHIRNFSVRDESTSEANRGKYMAFTELESAPMQHLAELQEAGLTHFHVLPANDIATVNEDPARTVEWTSTIQEFCALTPSSAVCNDNTERTLTIEEYYQSLNVLTEPGKAQEFTEQLRNFDLFNWGYDPKHFNTPEGSYSSDADSTARIKEMRAMNQALHSVGLRVALDVVYNHTNASGLFQNSVFDKVVPGYYHRYTIETGDIVRETCCDDTEPRNRMMEKFMEDSLLMWSEQYKFDAFRFDIMSQASKTTMVELFESVKAVDEDVYFYGEGWGKNTAPYGDFEIASQFNMAGTEIGTFNDRIREDVRQGQIFSREASDDALNAQDRVKSALAGTLDDFVLKTSSGNDTETSNLGGYAKDPADIINYISKHDNETLWDQFNYTLPSDLTLAERVRAQNVGLGITLMSQGIPFFQMGADLLRSKSMDRNTFDAGDWFNYVDFTKQTNNWNIGLPLAQDNQGRWEEISQFMNAPERAAGMNEIEFASEVFKELLSIRTDSKLFRLTTADDIKQRVGFHNIGSSQQQGLIAMSIDDGANPDSDLVLADLDSENDAIMVVINSGYEEKSIEVLTAAGFELHDTLVNSVDPTVRDASFTDTTDGDTVKGQFTVPAMTVAVFVKPQGAMQGLGLSALATQGAPDVVPYGDATIYLRGSINGWNATDPLTYKGEGVYEVTFEMTAMQSIDFKIADIDYGDVNLGNDNGTVTEDEAKTLNRGGNLTFTSSVEGFYLFSLNASDTDNPVLTVSNEQPYDFPVYVRGLNGNWDATEELQYEGGLVYRRNIELTAQEHNFKIANIDYDTVNLGAESGSDATVEVGVEREIVQGGDNLVMNITDAGTYNVFFDLNDSESLKVRVFNEEFFSEQAFIRGNMNGWAEANPLVYNNDGTYSVEIALEAGDAFFKVANTDYTTINMGATSDDESEVTISEGKVLFQDSNSANLSITDAAAGTYKFTVTGPDGNKPTLTVTTVD